MMFLTTVIFIVLIVIVSYSVFFVIETKNAFDVFRDGRLEVEYKELLTGVGDIVTLNESNINNHDNFKTRYSFKVSNGSKDKIKYRVVLEIDDEMIEMDDCKNNIINNDAIMYSIAGSDDKALNVLDDSNEFILKEGIIDGRTSIESDLDIWIDKDKIVDITKNHFHGKIRVEDIDK